MLRLLIKDIYIELEHYEISIFIPKYYILNLIGKNKKLLYIYKKQELTQ
jgi:hypothetical protein